LLRKEWRKQRDCFGQAFAWKHELHSGTPAEPDPDREPLSEAEIHALARLMQGMEETSSVSTRRLTRRERTGRNSQSVSATW
jgi:hypothetical protein